MCVHMCMCLWVYSTEDGLKILERHMYNKQMFLYFAQILYHFFSYLHKFQDRSVNSSVLKFLFNVAICSIRRRRHFKFSLLPLHYSKAKENFTAFQGRRWTSSSLNESRNIFAECNLQVDQIIFVLVDSLRKPSPFPGSRHLPFRRWKKFWSEWKDKQ